VTLGRPVLQASRTAAIPANRRCRSPARRWSRASCCRS